MSEKNEERGELPAEQYFERAALALQSGILSDKDSREVAIQLAKKAFDLNPSETRYIALLYEICMQSRMSLFQAGVTQEQFRQAYSNNNTADYIQGRIDDFFIELQETAERPHEMSDLHHTQLVLETLEEIVKIGPQPFLMRRLYYVYRLIGRVREALDYLLKAANIDVVETGPKYIHACYNLQRFDEMIDYFEKNESVLRPLLNDEKRTMLALAYEHRSDNLTHEKNCILEEESDFRAGYTSLKKAESLYTENYEKSQPGVTGKKYPTPDELRHTINYGQIFTQQALLIGNNQHSDPNLPNASELRKKAIEIFEEALARIGERVGFQKWRDVANAAKIQLVCASADEDLGIEVINRAVEIAREVRADPESKSLYRYDVLPSNLANLLVMQCKMTGSPEPDAEIEELLLESYKYNWEDPLSYTPLVEFYAKHNNFFKAKLFESFSEMSLVLRHLIDLDRWQVDAHEFIAGYHIEPSTLPIESEDQYWKMRDDIYEKVEQANIDLREYFMSLKKAMEPYIDKYKRKLSKMFPGSQVDGRGKDFLSILLKMLKEEKETLSQITDLIGFRVLTDTEDQAREAYSKVRADIKEDPQPKEWLTLDKPTKTGYRSLDITGYTKEDGVQIQVQIRPKDIDREINATYAHHDYYKQESGMKLEEKVNKDPVRYLTLLYVISVRLGEAYRQLSEKGGDLNIHEVLKVYEEATPPEFECFKSV